MDLNAVNKRVDHALALNRRAENVVISMAVSIFVLGGGIIIVGYLVENAYVSGGAMIIQLTLYWPIREILKLRRDNIILQILPAMISNLPTQQAAQEIKKLLEYLRGK